MKKRWIAGLLVLVMLLCLTAGCQKRQAPETTEPATEAPASTAPAPTVIIETESEPVTTQPETAEPEETVPALPAGQMYSYFTGLPVPEEQGNRRAVGVIINNVEAALPQAGVSSAEVVFECPIAGGSVRLLAIYPDGHYDDIPKIGSIRSARTFFVLIQSSLQCIFVHNGKALFAVPYLEMPHIQRMDGTMGRYDPYYFRTNEKKSPHNLFTSGALINKGIAKFEYDTKIPDGFVPFAFDYSGETINPTVAEGEPASKISIGYRINKPYFVYDKEKDLYYRYQFDRKHIDQNDNKQVAVNNIVVTYHTVSNYDQTDYLNITLDGTGDGYYFTNGKYIPITWSRSFEWGVTHYYDLDGNEIHLTPGKTWFCVVPNSRREYLKIEP
ncbi:MAG: DUF3048 domain-containing protein [Lachnospiraceae bacterium]|nr:DUF3048 domain-containing protein [Lachnospiraceae bacterium]